MRNTAQRKINGFTLVEIMIVMVIIGVLAVLGIGNFQSSQQKARDANRKSDLRQIANTLEAYFADYGQYPLSSNGQIMGCNGGQICGWGGAFVDAKGTVYMVELAGDPRSPRQYYYSSTDGRSYQLYALLENALDFDVPKTIDNTPGGYENTDCGVGICNYGVASSNTSPTMDRVITAL